MGHESACSITGWKCWARGAILVGLVLGGDRRCSWSNGKFVNGGAFALAGAALTFFGFMHSETLGINVNAMVSLAYVLMAGFLYACARSGVVEFGARPEPVASDSPSALPAE
jgi:AGZA family xanthine/uracil permease-like MFS transporter